MIASFGRNGVAASLSVTYRPSATKTRYLASSHLLHPTYPYRAIRPQHPYLRLLSTSEKPSTSPAGQEPIPSVLPQAKKVKADFRPGPVKPIASSGPAAASANPNAAKVESVGKSGKESVEEAAAKEKEKHDHELAHEGLVEAAKHDVQEASQHGILAPPPPGAGKFKTLIHQAKELFKFYFRGIKLIWTNRLRVKEMEERVRTGGPALTRWETRFIETYKQDVLKLIPFALIILIAEEVIPLVVMYTPFILPSTCILPSQKERIDAKRREKQQAVGLVQKSMFEEIRKRNIDMKNLRKGELGALNGLLALPTYGPTTLLSYRLRNHLARIAADDALLIKESLGAKLTQTELRDALDERGIISEGLTLKQLHSRLQWWLKHVNSPSASEIDGMALRAVLVARSGAGKF